MGGLDIPGVPPLALIPAAPDSHSLGMTVLKAEEEPAEVKVIHPAITFVQPAFPVISITSKTLTPVR